MSEILCSIIIPYYNVPCELVNKCLTSILNQNWDGNNYEVIFVNDGSPLPVDDSTKEILSKFKKHFLFEQENGGLSSARNTGLSIATGDYIFFVDPDDYWFANKLGDLLPHLKQKEYDIIKFQSVHIFDNKEPQVPQSQVKISECTSGCEHMSRANIIMGACTYCYRTAFLKEQQIFMPEGIIHEDEWFLTIAFFKAKKCFFTQVPLYAYMRREGSITALKTEQQWSRSLNDTFTIIKDTAALKNNASLDELQIKAIENRLSMLLYRFIYNLTISNLNKSQKQQYINQLQEIGLYPLPCIGTGRMYKLLQLCSKNNVALNLFVKTIQAINNRRVKGKIY